MSAELTAALGAHGATSICHVDGDLAADYDPEVWGEALAAAVAQIAPHAVVGLATDRSGEVLAHAAAIADAPLAANVTAVSTGPGEWAVTRIRWGGALIEEASLTAPVRYLTAAPHVFVTQAGGGTAPVIVVTPDWSPTRRPHPDRRPHHAGLGDHPDHRRSRRLAAAGASVHPKDLPSSTNLPG